MDKAMYYKLRDGSYLLLSDKKGFFCRPETYNLESVIKRGLEEVGWDASNAPSREMIGAKPVMRGAMLRW